MKLLDTLNNAADSIGNDIEKNKPFILMAISLLGVVATAVEAAYAKPKADALIMKRHAERQEPETKAKEIARDVAVAVPVYLPAMATGVMTIGCMVGSYSESSKRTAAYATAYTLTESKLKDYQAKVIETLGEKKEQKIRADIAKDKIAQNPPKEDFVLNDQDTLFYDSASGRYFKANIEDVRRAIANLNERLYSEMFISLNDFYYEIGIPEIRLGENLGFNVEDGVINIPLDQWVDYNGKPCLMLDYDYATRFDWRSLH